MTRKELKHNFINGVMDLRNKGLVEQDSLLDLFEDVIEPCIADLEKENAELKSNRDYWKGSSIYWHKQLKNKKYRKIAKATQQQLAKAKDHIKKLLDCLKQDTNDPQTNYYVCQYMDKAEQFLKENA